MPESGVEFLHVCHNEFFDLSERVRLIGQIVGEGVRLQVDCVLEHLRLNLFVVLLRVSEQLSFALILHEVEYALLLCSYLVQLSFALCDVCLNVEKSLGLKFDILLNFVHLFVQMRVLSEFEVALLLNGHKISFEFLIFSL